MKRVCIWISGKMQNEDLYFMGAKGSQRQAAVVPALWSLVALLQIESHASSPCCPVWGQEAH